MVVIENKKIISFRISLEDLQKMLEVSKDERRTLSSFILNVVMSYIENKQNEVK